jgi:hypothetical protein
MSKSSRAPRSQSVERLFMLRQFMVALNEIEIGIKHILMTGREIGLGRNDATAGSARPSTESGQQGCHCYA